MILFLSLLYILYIIQDGYLVTSLRINCCDEKSSDLSTGCEKTVTVGNGTNAYFCLAVEQNCQDCILSRNTSLSSCYQCCVLMPINTITNNEVCGTPYTYITATSWSKS